MIKNYFDKFEKLYWIIQNSGMKVGDDLLWVGNIVSKRSVSYDDEARKSVVSKKNMLKANKLFKKYKKN